MPGLTWGFRGGIPGVFVSYVSIVSNMVMVTGTVLTQVGHLTDESDQSRGTYEIVHGLLDRCLCRDWRDSDRGSGNRQGRVRGCDESEETASAMTYAVYRYIGS